MIEPYREAAIQYLESGLGYPIPSAYPYEKFPPIKGWTGINGATPYRTQVEQWRIDYPNSNILLRLKHNIIGIDVDNYGDKRGMSAIRKGEAAHGMLLANNRSTARHDDPRSGIRLLRLYPHMNERDLKGDLGTDSHVEIIRYSHRYAVVSPSWHPTAEDRYRWYPSGIPRKESLTYVGNSWWRHLTQKCDCFWEQRRRAREQLRRYHNRPLNAAGSRLAALDFAKNIETLTSMPMGGRNNFLSRVAGHTFLFDCLTSGVLDLNETWDRLEAAGRTAGLDDNEIQATLSSARTWAFNEREGDKR